MCLRNLSYSVNVIFFLIAKTAIGKNDLRLTDTCGMSDIEHNYGHGKEHLSTLLLTLNILAFLIHTLMEFIDEKYRLIRATLPTRKMFFDDVRALTRYICFGSWDNMMDFMLKGLEINMPPDQG